MKKLLLILTKNTTMKRVLLILLCLPMIGIGQCISGDCENGQGTYTWENPWEQYVGEWKDGKFNGKGTYTYADGKIEEGNWKNGNFTGDYNANIDEVFMVVENMPEFPGGDLGLMKYLKKNITYPPVSKKNNVTGKVYISFIVDKSGQVINVKVVREVDKYLDAEAVRVIKSLPKYKPGMQRGRAVNVQYTIPINFTLNKPK